MATTSFKLKAKSIPEHDLVEIAEFASLFDQLSALTGEKADIEKLIADTTDAEDELIVAQMEVPDVGIPLNFDWRNPPISYAVYTNDDTAAEVMKSAKNEMTERRKVIDAKVHTIENRMRTIRSKIYSKYGSEQINMDFERE